MEISEQLSKKVKQSINLIESFSKGHEVEVAYSGGKDSDVILQLCNMANVYGCKFRPIYKMTTIDPPGTIQHCKDMGVEIIRPKYTFAKLIQKKGMPSRLRRFCCEYLKEYKVLDYSIMGIRRCESTKRRDMYIEPMQCRFYGSKKNHVSVLYPILEWTNDDVYEFIEWRGIKCAPLYYDDKGKFDVNRRLGCMICPLKSRTKLIQVYKDYPNFVKFMTTNLRKFFDTHPKSKSRLDYDNNQYACFISNLFFQNRDKYDYFINNNLFGDKLDPKQFLQDFFQIKF